MHYKDDCMFLLESIEEKFSKNIDFKKKTIKIGDKFWGTLVFLEGVVGKEVLSDSVLKPLIQENIFYKCQSVSEVSKAISDGGIYLSNCQEITDIEILTKKLLFAHSALFIEGLPHAFVFETISTNVRQISEPSSENVSNGAKDSFLETLNLNISTVRKRLRSTDLVIEQMEVGLEIPTSVAVVYMNGTTDPEIVKRVKSALKNNKIKTVSSLSVIDEALIAPDSSIFPQNLYTERPDKFCSNITDGYVGILVDGFPFSIITPATLLSLMQAPEDYSKNSLVASIIRSMRFFMLIVALILPGIYIAIMTFHHDIMPSTLAISIIQARMEVPFDEAFETLLMLVAFEILTESGLRIPQNIGQMVSIVGALIVGEAAVSAKLVSPFVIIVVAFSVIGSFTIPNMELGSAVRIWRFILALIGAFTGLFGIGIGLIIMTLQVANIKTQNIPFLEPFISKRIATKDSFFRRPFSKNKYKPKYLTGSGDNENE